MSHDKIFVSQIVPKFYHQLSKFYYQLIYDVILKWFIKKKWAQKFDDVWALQLSYNQNEEYTQVIFDPSIASGVFARYSPLFWRDSIKILELNYQQYPSSNQIKIVCSKTLRFYLTDFIVYHLLIKIFLTWLQNHASQSLIIKCLTSLRLEANWNSMLQKIIFLYVCGILSYWSQSGFMIF